MLISWRLVAAPGDNEVIMRWPGGQYMFTLNSLWDFCFVPTLWLRSHRFERPAGRHPHQTESLLSALPPNYICAFQVFLTPPPPRPPSLPHLQRKRVDGLPPIAFVSGVIELGWSTSEGAWGYMLHTKRARFRDPRHHHHRVGGRGNPV